MLSILSKLTCLKQPSDFGIKCFNTLRDLMIAGDDLEKQIIAIIEKDIIKKLDNNPSVIPVSLLVGL